MARGRSERKHRATSRVRDTCQSNLRTILSTCVLVADVEVVGDFPLVRLQFLSGDEDRSNRDVSSGDDVTLSFAQSETMGDLLHDSLCDIGRKCSCDANNV